MSKKTDVKILKDGVQIYDGRTEKFIRTTQEHLEYATKRSGTKNDIIAKLMEEEKENKEND